MILARAVLVAAACCVAFVVGGCGSGHKASPSAEATQSRATASSGSESVAAQAAAICAKGRGVVAAGSGVAVAKVSTRPIKSPTDGNPVCDFTAGAGRGAPAVSVELDHSPQPYQVLERRIDEEGQNFAMIKHFKYPQQIPHEGLDAAWFPREQQAQTTDGRVLITVTIVRWSDHRNGPRKALAAAVARPYLGRLVGRRSAKGEV